jgi:hypothetical protein
MKSITSKDALHNSFELAKSKTPPPLRFPTASFNLKPLPSSKFFLTLSFGSSGNFLASPPGSLPFLQEVKNITKIMIIKFLYSYFFNYSHFMTFKTLILLINNYIV